MEVRQVTKSKWKKRTEKEDEKRELGSFLYDLERSAKEILKRSNNKREAEAKRSLNASKRKRKRGKNAVSGRVPKQTIKKQNQSSAPEEAQHGLDITLDAINPSSEKLPVLDSRHVEQASPKSVGDPPIQSPSPQPVSIQEVRDRIDEIFARKKHSKALHANKAVPLKQAAKQPRGLSVKTQLAYSNKELKVPKCCYPGSLKPRAEHSVPRRLSVALWLDPTRKTETERGLSDSLTHSLSQCQNELQGPTNWSHVDLRLKYRDETRREQARQASLQVMAPTEFVGVDQHIVEIPVHSIHRDTLQLIEDENAATIRITNARNRLKTFLVDLNTIWRVNRPTTMVGAESKSDNLGENQKDKLQGDTVLETNNQADDHNAMPENKMQADGHSVIVKKDPTSASDSATSRETELNNEISLVNRGDSTTKQLDGIDGSTIKDYMSTQSQDVRSNENGEQTAKYGVPGLLHGLKDRRDPNAHEDITQPQAQSVSEECALRNAVSFTNPPRDGEQGYAVHGSAISQNSSNVHTDVMAQNEDALGEIVGRTVLPLGQDSTTRVHVTLYAPSTWTLKLDDEQTSAKKRYFRKGSDDFHFKVYHASSSEALTWTVSPAILLNILNRFRQHEALTAWHTSATMLRSGSLANKVTCSTTHDNRYSWQFHRKGQRKERFAAVVTHPRVDYLRVPVLCHVAYHRPISRPTSTTQQTNQTVQHNGADMFQSHEWKEGRVSYWIQLLGTSQFICQIHVPVSVIKTDYPTLPEPWWCDSILFPTVIRQIFRLPYWTHAFFGCLRGLVSLTECVSSCKPETLFKQEPSWKEKFVHQCCMLEVGGGGIGLVEYLQRIQWVEKLSLKHQKRYLEQLSAELHAVAMMYQLTDPTQSSSRNESIPVAGVPLIARIGCAHGPGFIPSAQVGFGIKGSPQVSHDMEEYGSQTTSKAHHEFVEIIAKSCAIPCASLLGRSNPVLALFFRNSKVQTAPVLQVLSQGLDHPLCAPAAIAFANDLLTVEGMEFPCTEAYIPCTTGSFYGYVMTTQVDTGISALITILSAAPTEHDIGGSKPELYSGHVRHLPQLTDRQFRQVLVADVTHLTQPNENLEPNVFGISGASATLCVADTWPFRYTWHSHDNIASVLVRERLAVDFRAVNTRVATVGGNDPLCFALNFTGYEHRGVYPMSRSKFFEMEMQRIKEQEQERRANRTRAQLEIYRQRQAAAARERLMLQKTIKDKLLADSIKAQGRERMKKSVGNRTEDWLERINDPLTKKAGTWKKWQAYMYMDSEARATLDLHRQDAEKLQLALIAMGEDIKTAEELVAEEKELYLKEGTLFYQNKAENLFQWDQPRGWQGVACIQDNKDDEEDDDVEDSDSNHSKLNAEEATKDAGETTEDDFDPSGGSLDVSNMTEEQLTSQRLDDEASALSLAKRVDQARRLRAIEFVVAGWLDHRADLPSPRETVAGAPPVSTGNAFNLLECFREIDEMESGLVNHEEFKLGLAQLGFEFSTREQETLLLHHDTRGLGMVDYYEVVDWILNIPCRSSDSWFEMTSQGRPSLPSEWEAMRARDKQVDSILEWRQFRDSDSHEFYYWNTKTNESSWRRPKGMSTAIQLRRDAQELAEAQQAASLAAKSAAAASARAERASDRSVSRLVRTLASSSAFVDLLSKSMGWKLSKLNEVSELREEVVGSNYDSQSEPSDDDASYSERSFYSDEEDDEYSETSGMNMDDDSYVDYDEESLPDGFKESLNIRQLETGSSEQDKRTQSRKRKTKFHSSRVGSSNVGASRAESSEINKDETGQQPDSRAEIEAEAGYKEQLSSNEATDEISDSVPDRTRSGDGASNKHNHRASTAGIRLPTRAGIRDSRRNSTRRSSRRRSSTRGGTVQRSRRASKITTPMIRDLGATLSNEIKAMREDNGKAMADHMFRGSDGSSTQDINMRLDADVALEKPGLGWRMLKPGKEAVGFITRCSNPRTMGLKHALMTPNRPSLVGVVDAAEVTHFSFNDFPPLNTILVTDLVAEAARAALKSAGEHGFGTNAQDMNGAAQLKGEEKVAKMLEDALAGNNNMDMLDMTHKAFLAVKNGKLNELEMLIDEGVQISDRDENGNTMLHVAAQQGLKRISKYLLRKGAEINAQNLAGNTVLHYCFEYSAQELAEYFISKGADDSLLNAEGLTCYEGLRKDDLDNL